MKLKDSVYARDPLQKLVMQDLPIKEAYSLKKTTDFINANINFFYERLAALGEDPDENRVNELYAFEVPDLEKVEISMIDGLKLSASDVALLEPFITFKAVE